jgi:toxin ParE1/3/4
MLPVKYSDKAADDLDGIAHSIAARASDRIATGVVADIVASLESLGFFPFMGTARPRLGRAIRGWPVAPYVAFYRANDDHVQIVRVIHGRRRITRKLIREGSDG